MNRYRVVFLDADETLFDYLASEKTALRNTMKHFGIPWDDSIGRDYSILNLNLWHAYEKKQIDHDFIGPERFRQLMEIHSPEFLNFAEMNRIYCDFLAEDCTEFPDAPEICRWMKEQGFMTVLISNGSASVQHRKLARAETGKYMDYVILAEEAGFCKPDPGIFEYAEKITGFTDKSRMIIIGDSLTSDMTGGKNYGIDTCWFNSRHEINTSGIVPDYETDCLLKLKKILSVKA